MLEYLHSYSFSMLDWGLVVLGSVLVGMSKGGLPGISGIAVWIYVKELGAKQSVGMLVSILICADIYAVIIYRRHTDLRFVRVIVPFLMIGTLAGMLLFSVLPDAFYEHVIGSILVSLVLFHLVLRRSHREPEDDQFVERNIRLERIAGTASGLFSMLANVGSALLVAYLIRLKLPRLVFLGTFAALILVSNVICLPLHYLIGTVTLNDLPLSFSLGLLSIVGVVAARLLVSVIPQKLYEAVIWTVIALAGLELLI